MTVETLNFVPETLSNYPVHTGGDQDFWGPPVFAARIWLEQTNQVVRLNMEAYWREPKPDFTTFKSRTTRILYDIRRAKGPGWVFDKFDDRYDLHVQELTIPGTNKGLQEIYTSNEGLVSSVKVVGDSWGGPFGGPDRPYVEVTFNRVRFDVKK
jgi:hypothetical protein